MRASRLLLLAASLSLVPPAWAYAQQGMRWQPNLETARRVAAQTNRLVLVHFWKDQCPPCKRMQDDVFPRGDVASTLEANFVPVQINGQHFPKTAREFGVTRYPTDVIITPDGYVVDRAVGALPPGEYVERLGRVAAAARGQPQPDYRQIAAGPVSSDAATGTVARGQTTDRGQRSTPAADPWGDPRGRQPVGSPLLGETPASYQGLGTTAARGPSPPAGPAPIEPWVRPQPGPQPNRAPEPAPRQAGLPPLGLDGYCPVQLLDSETWVKGDPRFGVIHRDRLYLFPGPSEARRFFDDPERYAPVLSGHDVVLAVDQNQLVAGSRKFGVRYDGDNRVYLFASQATRDRFSQAPERYVAAMSARAAADTGRRAPPPPEEPYGPAPGLQRGGRF